MLDRGATERAVLAHDAELAATAPGATPALGVRGEAVRSQRVGDRVQGGTERPVCVGVWFDGSRQDPAVLGSDLFGHRLGLLSGQQGQRPAEQGDEEIVMADRDIDLHLR